MLGSPEPAHARRHRLPHAGHLGRPRRLRRPARRPRRRDGRRPDRRPRRAATPTPSSGAAFSVLVLAECIDRDNAATCCPPARCSSGATGSPRGTSASGTCAASSPARAGRTPSPTAPTRSACWPARRTSAARADRAARRARRPAARPGRRLFWSAASPTGWRWPRWRCCAATWCRSTVLEPWIARLAAGGRARRRRRDATRSRRPRNAQAFLRALHLQLVLAPQPARRALRPAAGAGRRAARRPTRPTSPDAPRRANPAAVHDPRADSV